MGNWKDIRARRNGKCRHCKKPVAEGDRIFWLPGDHSASGYAVTLCRSCFKKNTSLGAYEKTTEVPPEARETSTKKTTLRDIVKGVGSMSIEDSKEGDALDIIMNDAFDEHKRETACKKEKEVERYSLAWFAAGAKWKLG